MEHEKLLNQFEADRQIDPGQLDLEAATQADRFFRYAEAAVQAKANADRARLRAEHVAAQLQMDCRNRPQKFGLEKVTEGAIEAAVHLHPDYKKAQDELLEARRLSALMDRAVDAMEQRKRMLEVLVTLHGQQYFAGPSVPRDLVGAWRERQERLGAEVNDRQRAKARRRGDRGKGT